MKEYLHPRNRNRERYDLKAMIKTYPELEQFTRQTKEGGLSLDFGAPNAIRTLNIAILKHYYNIKYWEFPIENLSPGVPGRAEYIHNVADLLIESSKEKFLHGDHITCLDIGTGANCIYPIIGIVEYGWKFIASDVDIASLENAEAIISSNPNLRGQVTLKHQKNKNFIYRGVIPPKTKIELTICNPPFHATEEELLKGNKRKLIHLTGSKDPGAEFNFAGITNELVYKGGEFKFIKRMIKESGEYAKSVFWFTSLVSKESNLKKLKNILKDQRPEEVRVIDIQTGNKKSRILAWTYLTKKEKESWKNERWMKNINNK